MNKEEARKVSHWETEIQNFVKRKPRKRTGGQKKRSKLYNHMFWLIRIVFFMIVSTVEFLLNKLVCRKTQLFYYTLKKVDKKLLSSLNTVKWYKTSELFPGYIVEKLKALGILQVRFEVMKEDSVDWLCDVINRQCWKQTFGFFGHLVRFGLEKMSRKKLLGKFATGFWVGFLGRKDDQEKKEKMLAIGHLAEIFNRSNGSNSRGSPLYRFPGGKKKRSFLSTFSIPYQYQKLGIARLWMNFANIALLKAGVEEFWLDIGRFQRKNSQPLYKKIGFEVVDHGWVKQVTGYMSKQIIMKMCF